MNKTWYIIFNPTSGGGKSKNKLNKIIALFNQYDLKIITVTTQYPHHEEELVTIAIKQGYTQFVCIGGDGTIHHIINGIMRQAYIESDKIKLAVIPIGTGNDWVKNYNIPRNTENAVKVIQNNNSILQDIGLITLLENKKQIFFNNAAGIGFDAYVVKNLYRYKKWGSLAYLFAALFSFKSYKNGTFSVFTDHKEHKSMFFMISIGIGKYSGAGMQLTDFKNHKEGYFDVTLIRSIKLLKVIANIAKLYNGSINELNEVESIHVQELTTFGNTSLFIQADGEIIGNGDVRINVIPRAIQFIIK
jgi:YegS/Rv2252/BmrU family lipid kinase